MAVKFFLFWAGSWLMNACRTLRSRQSLFFPERSSSNMFVKTEWLKKISGNTVLFHYCFFTTKNTKFTKTGIARSAFLTIFFLRVLRVLRGEFFLFFKQPCFGLNYNILK